MNSEPETLAPGRPVVRSRTTVEARTKTPHTGHRTPPDTAFFDRDLGWLEFNRRVLAEAVDERTPLLERLKFLAIFDSNLDEFFMKRLAAVRTAPRRRADRSCNRFAPA